MAITLIALVLLETVLLMAWVAGYFSWGITLFNERIAAPPYAGPALAGQPGA